MSQDSLQPKSPEMPYIILNPSDPDVRKALFDFAYASSAISTVIFLREFNNEPYNSESDDSHYDSTTYGTDKGDILDSLAEGRLFASLAVVATDGVIEIVPPLKDKLNEEKILKGFLRVAEEVVLRKAI